MKKLIIFVKAPRPGFVKTRLALILGPDAAADAYITLVETLLANLTTPAASRKNRVDTRPTNKSGPRLPHSATACAQTSAFRPPHSIELRFTPDDAFDEIQPWMRPTWSACAQGTGNLGKRMQRAFLQAFAAGAERVVLIGSDCPTITTGDIQRAWRALASHDLVLGPATDGGYWLIGLTSNPAALFEGINWGTKTVLSETLARAAKLRFRVHLLASRTDIDTEKDWQEYLRGNPTTRIKG